MTDKDFDQVLLVIKLHPFKNYCGAEMVDYKIVKRRTAKIIKKIIRKYSEQGFSFYCGSDEHSQLENVTINIIDDPDLIAAYQLLSKEDLISPSYYVYDLVVECLMMINRDWDNYNGEFDCNVPEDKIWDKWDYDLC